MSLVLNARTSLSFCPFYVTGIPNRCCAMEHACRSGVCPNLSDEAWDTLIYSKHVESLHTTHFACSWNTFTVTLWMPRLNFYQAYKSPALIEHTTFYTALFNRLHSTWLIAAPHLSLALRSHVYLDMSVCSELGTELRPSKWTPGRYIWKFFKKLFLIRIYLKDRSSVLLNRQDDPSWSY